eukprot:GGOE01029343.1.p2 GENE.GGOE01029343.1~~GGOE01029343.1.p2  ORF type:complete len:162 (+),score=57.13 GGOE01029343.1:43-528(+)
MATQKTQRFTPYVPDLGHAALSGTPPNEELDGMLRSLMTEMSGEAPEMSVFNTPPKTKYCQQAPEASNDIEGMLKSLMTELKRNKQETGQNYWEGMKPSTLPRFNFQSPPPEAAVEFTAAAVKSSTIPDADLLAQLDLLGDALEADRAAQAVRADSPAVIA